MSQESNILGLSRDDLLSLILEIETEPKRASMRVNQIWSWIYCHGISSFDNMTNIDKNLRTELKKVFKISRPNIEKKEVSNDGTTKYLFCLEDQSKIETVFIPEEKRSTLCISSQVGCTLNCTFCYTGTQKLVRNLTSEEIVSQLLVAKDELSDWSNKHGRKISNVVFMVFMVFKTVFNSVFNCFCKAFSLTFFCWFLKGFKKVFQWFYSF